MLEGPKTLKVTGLIKKPAKDQTGPLSPAVISDVMLAFPADVRELLPLWDEIPVEYKDQHNVWHRLADYWFSVGLAGTTEFHCKEGIDGATAVRHLRAIQGSYQPKHEHKLAGVAYLASSWFDKVENYEFEGRHQSAPPEGGAI